MAVTELRAESAQSKPSLVEIAKELEKREIIDGTILDNPPEGALCEDIRALLLCLGDYADNGEEQLGRRPLQAISRLVGLVQLSIEAREARA